MRRHHIGALPIAGGSGMAHPAAPTRDTSVPLPCVLVIGVSFDGIRAVGTVLRGLPDPFPGAVLVVLHRGTGGQAASVLSRLAGRAVTEPEDGAALEVARVYLAPGDRHLIVRDGRIGIEHSERVRFSRPSIDVLFESVAKVYGPRAIGVLLSGYGSDGVAGLHTIRAQGGTTIVQDPSEARAPHLPRAAIAADGIDLTLPLREIGPAIGRLIPKAISSPSMPSDDIAAQ